MVYVPDPTDIRNKTATVTHDDKVDVYFFAYTFSKKSKYIAFRPKDIKGWKNPLIEIIERKTNMPLGVIKKVRYSWKVCLQANTEWYKDCLTDILELITELSRKRNAR